MIAPVLALALLASPKPAPAADAPVSTVPGLAPVASNPNLLQSGVPALPKVLQDRVLQYQNSRSAVALAVTPDGKQVLLSTRFASTAQLHVVEQPMGARFQLTFTDEPIGKAVFSPQNPELVYYLQDKGGGEFFQVYRFDRRTGASELLTDGKSRQESLLLSRDGQSLAYASTQRNGKDTEVYVAPAAAPKDVKRVLGGEGSFTPLDFSPDGKALLALQYRSISDADLWWVDLAAGKQVRLTPDPTSAGPASVALARFTADGRGVYLATNRYSDFNELYRLELAQPTAAPTPLTRGIRWDVEDLAVARDGSRVAVTINEEGYSKVYVLEKGGAPKQVPTPAGVVASLLIPEKRSDQLIVSVSDPAGPTDVWQVDAKTGKQTRWTRSEAGGLPLDRFVRPSLVRYPSTDGVTVPAFLYRPDEKQFPGKRPVVVVWHGGPESQSRPSFNPFVQLLAIELGYAVLVPNVRGSQGYGKTYVGLDDGVLREKSLADIGATLDFVAAQPFLDAAKVAVYGGSYGGYLVLASLAFFPGRVAAGIDVVGISSLPTFLQSTQAYRRDLRRAEYGDERIAEVRAVQERISPLNKVEAIRSALFVIQGKNDPRVPQSEAEQIVKAVRAKGREVWYLLAVNEGHGFYKKENKD